MNEKGVYGMSGRQIPGGGRDKAINIPENQASTVLRDMYQGAAGEPHQPIPIASLDHPVGTTVEVLLPILAHLEGYGWVKTIADSGTVMLTEEGVAEAARRQ